MIPFAAEEQILAPRREEIFSLAADLAAVLETHNGENAARAEKPHQGVEAKNRTIAVGSTWIKWQETHQIGKLFLMAPANEKQQAHQLLDQLDAGQLAAVVHLLQVMTGPLSHSLASAPVEEEELTSETAAALDRARASLARGEGIPHEDILREFGLGK